jgi:hypothetical protein
MSDSRALLIQADLSATEVVSFKCRVPGCKLQKNTGATPNSPVDEEHFLNNHQPASKDYVVVAGGSQYKSFL